MSANTQGYDDDGILEIIPASFWESNGHSQQMARRMEGFLKQLNKVTGQLKEQQRNDELMSIKLMIFNIPTYVDDPPVLNDELFYPYWIKFAEALINYKHKTGQVYFHGFKISKGVADILIPAFKSKNLTNLDLSNPCGDLIFLIYFRIYLYILLISETLLNR